MSRERNRWVWKIAAALLVAGAVGLLIALPPGGRGPSPAPSPSEEDRKQFARHCREFLSHAVSAETFCEQARPPWVAEALRRPGTRVPATLPICGAVTLKGQADHSGTEIAAVVDYDPRYLDRVILSPFFVRTDDTGGFDLSLLELKAWEAAPRRSARLAGTCYATEVAKPPTLVLYVRHKGFDSRIVTVGVDAHPLSRLPSKDDPRVNVGCIELLAEGSAEACYMAFGARTYPPPSVYDAFSQGRCEPRAVASHLEKCPGCAVADDALFYFIFLEIVNKGRRSGPEDQRQALEEFRRNFWDGRDNTGLLPALMPGTSPDATWHNAVVDIEAEFYGGRSGYYRGLFDRNPKAAVAALRRSPDHLPYIRDWFCDLLSHEYAYGKRPLTDELSMLLYMALARQDCRPWAYPRLTELKDTRAVPLLIQAIKERPAELPEVRNVLRALTGKRLDTLEEWLKWWEDEGSRAPWPAAPRITEPHHPPAEPAAQPDAAPAGSPPVALTM